MHPPRGAQEPAPSPALSSAASSSQSPRRLNNGVAPKKISETVAAVATANRDDDDTTPHDSLTGDDLHHTARAFKTPQPNLPAASRGSGASARDRSRSPSRASRHEGSDTILTVEGKNGAAGHMIARPNTRTRATTAAVIVLVLQTERCNRDTQPLISGKPTHRGSRGGKGRHKAAPQEGSGAVAGSNNGTSAPSIDVHAGPSNARISAYLSADTNSHPPAPGDGPTLNFVTPPPDLLSTLRDGPPRKRKRLDEDDAAHGRSFKRMRWEDEFDADVRGWLYQVRSLAENELKKHGSVQLEKEALLREVELLRTSVAELRWDVSVLRGLSDETGNAHWEFVEEELRRLRNPPARDDSKRLNMYGDTDLSDASDTDDMNVRSELDDDDEYVHDARLGYGEWKKRPDEPRDRNASRTRAEPRANASRARPQSRPGSPPRWDQSRSRARSPLRHPTPSTSRGIQPDGAQDPKVSRPSRAPPPLHPAPAPVDYAASIDEVVMEGVTIDVVGDIDAPDIHDADVEHALAAAEQDQRAMNDNFISRSLDAILETLPHANLRAAMRETLWDFTSGYQLPMPLGRYGHPHLKNWSWGDIDPRRIFKDSYSGAKLAKDSAELKRLALEAVMLPFAGRSITQRVVVGWAHRDGILPLPGWRAEPDIMHEARSNPSKVTTAVRRQNSVNREKCVMYTEWDLVDFECMLLIRMSRPPNVPRALRQTVQVGNEWNDMIWDAL
ncbi:hypothetical protein AURDEDRAFT_160887, partial [Auricularia subglabra TFB-10046 SS5]